MTRREALAVPAVLACAALVTAAGLLLGSSALDSPATNSTASAGAIAITTGSTSSVAPAVRANSPEATTPPAVAESAPSPSPSAAATSPVSAAGVPFVEVPIVPVTNFRSSATSTTLAEVRAVLGGTSSRYQALEVVGSDADAILAALGTPRSGAGSHLVLADDAAHLATDLTRSGRRLAFLRADEVTPAVRALGWGSIELFGVARVREPAAWPLTARLPAGPADEAFDPARTWTLFAGGDILLDRGVYQTVRLRRKGVDFPFNGGTAEITSRYCCSTFGWELPRTRRTGHAGAVRSLIENADLAIANFENPAPDRPRYHTSGTVFSADPALIPGLADAGLDYVSVANNHIRDAGGAGVLQTIANLTANGIRSSGSGKDLSAARRPAIFDVDGTTVAILGYDAIAEGYHATATRIGSAPLTAAYVRADVAAARAAGADVVIVFPHWGTEYRAKPFEGQQRLARMIIDAGADMVIGNHAHWAAAMEVYRGRPIWYALGNFVFDQTWSEPTMEGITLELTFQGAELVQARLRPHIILDKAQPNFLDPAGDGKVVMGQVYSASKGLLPW